MSWELYVGGTFVSEVHIFLEVHYGLGTMYWEVLCVRYVIELLRQALKVLSNEN